MALMPNLRLELNLPLIQNNRDRINRLLLRVATDPLAADLRNVRTINCLNGYSLAVALENEDFYNALIASDILLCDGILIKILCRLRIGSGVERVTGPFYAEGFIAQNLGSFLFLGSSNDVGKRLISNIQTNLDSYYEFYSPIFVSEIDEEIILECAGVITNLKPDFVFLGLSAPKQEILAYRLSSIFPDVTFLQVGAYFDFLAGTIKRAPKFFSWMGMEWLWRFFLQPKKIGGRIFALRILILNLLKD